MKQDDTDEIRILAVDDDELMLGIVRIALSRAGFVVETVSKAAEALDALERFAPSLVLLDVSMPELTGWELLRRIREQSDLPVMFVSGRDDDIDKVRGLDLGADDYLTKPFSMMELEARVNAVLRRAAGGRRARVA
jgi:two-component system OmpR family response regulator